MSVQQVLGILGLWDYEFVCEVCEFLCVSESCVYNCVCYSLSLVCEV